MKIFYIIFQLQNANLYYSQKKDKTIKQLSEYNRETYVFRLEKKATSFGAAEKKFKSETKNKFGLSSYRKILEIKLKNNA